MRSSEFRSNHPVTTVFLLSLAACAPSAASTSDDAGVVADAPTTATVDAPIADAATTHLGSHDASSDHDVTSDAGPADDAPAVPDAAVATNIACEDALVVTSTTFIRAARSDLGDELRHGDCEGGTVARRSLWYAVTVPPAHRLQVRAFPAIMGTFYSGDERVLASCDGEAASCVSVGSPGSDAAYTNDSTTPVTRLVAVECPIRLDATFSSIPCDIEIHIDPS